MGQWKQWRKYGRNVHQKLSWKWQFSFIGKLITHWQVKNMVMCGKILDSGMGFGKESSQSVPQISARSKSDEFREPWNHRPCGPLWRVGLFRLITERQFRELSSNWPADRCKQPTRPNGPRGQLVDIVWGLNSNRGRTIIRGSHLLTF